MSRRRDTPYDTPYYLDWSCVMDQNPGFNFTHVRGVPHISFMFSGYFTHILREWNLHEFPGGCCGPRVDFNFTHVGKNDPTHTHTQQTLRRGIFFRSACETPFFHDATAEFVETLELGSNRIILASGEAEFKIQNLRRLFEMPMDHPWDDCSIFTYTWIVDVKIHLYIVNVRIGKYTIHGSYGMILLPILWQE